MTEPPSTPHPTPHPTPEPPAPQPTATPGTTVAPATVDVRSVSLAVLAVLASIFTLHWAREVFIPVMVGVLLSSALGPVVALMHRWRIARPLGAAVLLLLLSAAVGFTARSLADDAGKLLEAMPAATQKLRMTLRTRLDTSDGAIENVQKVAAELEQVAEETGSAPSPAKSGVTRVQIEEPAFDLKKHLWSGTRGVAGAASTLIVITFVTYFLLASGDNFRRKLVKIAGKTLTEKKLTVQALDEIEVQLQRYLRVQLFTSALVGAVTGLAFWGLGVDHAVVWGIAAGALNLIPYFGAVLVMGASALFAFLQFGALEMAAIVGGTAFAINCVEGYALTPWLHSRTSQMNPLAIFLGVLFWGWLWGVWGLLLGVPILMIVKAVCDRVDDLKPVGELLGE